MRRNDEERVVDGQYRGPQLIEAGDTDRDGLDDSFEQSLGTNPFDRDTDDDGVPDGAEWWGRSDPTDPDERSIDPVSRNHHAEARDSDGDGLYDNEELRHGANRYDRDSDDDGIDDLIEVLSGTSPRFADTDTDGLADGAERAAGTLPWVQDSDGDGYLDGVDLRPLDFGDDRDNDGLSSADEARFGTDPGRSDSDDDSLLDGEEVAIGTNPTLGDTDGDGVPDHVEVLRAVNRGLPEGEFARDWDSDDDGISDEEESLLGTRFDDADSDDDGVDDATELAEGTLEGLHDQGFFGGPTRAEQIAAGVQDAFTGGLDAAALEATFSADPDGDGVSDWEEANTWQAAAAADPANAWALGDDDGDGVPNLLDPTPTPAPPLVQDSAAPSDDGTNGSIRDLNGQPTPPEPDAPDSVPHVVDEPIVPFDLTEVALGSPDLVEGLLDPGLADPLFDISDLEWDGDQIAGL